MFQYLLENNNKPWSESDIQTLRRMAESNYRTGFIAASLKRSVEAIEHKASELGISLKPTDKH